MISETKLIKAFTEKWCAEHPGPYDNGGSMTYGEIIDFIREFAKKNKVED